MTETQHYAKKVLSACHSVGVIDRETGHPDTTKIDKTMVNKIAIISVPKQRELVDLLFFWEEELVRWRLLCDAEKEASRRVAHCSVDGGDLEDAKMTLEKVRLEKRLPPSARDESGQPKQGELPSYFP